MPSGRATPVRRPGIFVQDACYQHQYIRSRDLSAIVERPERLRAVTVGLAAAIARIEAASTSKPQENASAPLPTGEAKPLDADDLVSAMGRMNMNIITPECSPIAIVRSRASVELLNNPAVKFIHGDLDGDVYLEKLKSWATESLDKIRAGDSEIPEGLAQGDLYCGNPPKTPQTHAKHVGNGTQSIVWQINEETYRQKLEADAGAPDPGRPGLQLYYGSVHDILSYPCEDGKTELVQAASVSLHESHGQYIENVHLQPYDSAQHFWELYDQQYSKILHKAEAFFDSTGGPGDDAVVFISCGMDACEHEYASMSRHNRKVPTAFYHRFARDACALADRYAGGRVVSVLEGGYSDRALISGAMAHLVGLTEDPVQIDEDWWSVENLAQLEKATKKRRGGGRTSVGTPGGPVLWLERTQEIFRSLEPNNGKQGTPSSRTLVPPTSMKLRERKSKSTSPAPSPSLQCTRPESKAKARTRGLVKGKLDEEIPVEVPLSTESSSSEDNAPKKLPRVILRLGPDPSQSTGP
ncbi:hypothetical protein H0H81_010834 [Sphagnurus paluster]|uniref:Histone deacetylase domain-containing protein n=1 Tax=Sphagnurus paluster TaxID=117069 RepID=A0A9P7GN92_9AGAR|nr:hypothetical protein H0H81_010834 [Sphagnurus paluster]